MIWLPTRIPMKREAGYHPQVLHIHLLILQRSVTSAMALFTRSTSDLAVSAVNFLGYPLIYIRAVCACPSLPHTSRDSAIRCTFGAVERAILSRGAKKRCSYLQRLRFLSAILSPSSFPQPSSGGRRPILRKPPLIPSRRIPRNRLRTHLMPQLPTRQLDCRRNIRAQLTRFLHHVPSHLLHLHIASRISIHRLVFLSVSIIFSVGRWYWILVRRNFLRFMPSKKEERSSRSQETNHTDRYSDSNSCLRTTAQPTVRGGSGCPSITGCRCRRRASPAACSCTRARRSWQPHGSQDRPRGGKHRESRTIRAIPCRSIRSQIEIAARYSLPYQIDELGAVVGCNILLGLF